MTTHPTPPELVALVTDDAVQIALDASDAYWNADDRLEKCLACNGTGKVPCGESQDWCDCDGGTVNNGTEAGAMRAALDAVEATRAATVPLGVSEVHVLDRGFTFSKGVNVPTVLVGFAPEDWVSRDAYAAAIDPAMTPPPAELGEGS